MNAFSSMTLSNNTSVCTFSISDQLPNWFSGIFCPQSNAVSRGQKARIDASLYCLDFLDNEVPKCPLKKNLHRPSKTFEGFLNLCVCRCTHFSKWPEFCLNTIPTIFELFGNDDIFENFQLFLCKFQWDTNWVIYDWVCCLL